MRARSKTVFHILRWGGSQPRQGAATSPRSFSTELVLHFHTRFDQPRHRRGCWQGHWGEEVACPSITHWAAVLEDLPTPMGFADVDWKALSLFCFKQSSTCPGKLPDGYANADMGMSARNRRGVSVQPVFILDLLHFSSPCLVLSSLLALTGVVPLSS